MRTATTHASISPASKVAAKISACRRTRFCAGSVRSGSGTTPMMVQCSGLYRRASICQALSPLVKRNVRPRVDEISASIECNTRPDSTSVESSSRAADGGGGTITVPSSATTNTKPWRLSRSSDRFRSIAAIMLAFWAATLSMMACELSEMARTHFHAGKYTK
ncbi:Uncharacterised protein [Bordetella pertussis]|nr:Uncharacterised protein [Bordetella pertussis]CPM95481.1 Uncharacterised protein [Bordetella pertussis]